MKNITAHYRLLLDEILEQRPELARASSGHCTFRFRPDPDKTFNRSATDYFTNGRQTDIGAFDSPTFMGVSIGTVTRIGTDWFEMDSAEILHNGDGLSYMNKRSVVGTRANRVERAGDVWRVFPNEELPQLAGLRIGTSIYRNRDHAWEQSLLQKNSAERRIGVDVQLSATADGLALTLVDEDGCTATACVSSAFEPARSPEQADANLRQHLDKFGNTLFFARRIELALSRPLFVPASVLNALRRDAVAQLETARITAWQRPPRKMRVEPPATYPEEALSYLANVYNHKAHAFYEKHGVKLIAAAYEAHEEAGEVSLMITKHCLRFSYHLCPKQAKGITGVQGQVRAEPMTLINGNERLTLHFDCKACEMHVMGKMKKHILASPPPSMVPVASIKRGASPEGGR